MNYKDGLRLSDEDERCRVWYKFGVSWSERNFHMGYVVSCSRDQCAGLGGTGPCLWLRAGTCIIKGVDRPVGRKIPEPKTWELPGSFYHVDWGQRGSPN